MNDNFAARTPQHLPQSFIKIQLMRGQVEAGGLRLPGIRFLLEVHNSHKNLRIVAITIAAKSSGKSRKVYCQARRLGKRGEGQGKSCIYNVRTAVYSRCVYTEEIDVRDRNRDEERPR